MARSSWTAGMWAAMVGASTLMVSGAAALQGVPEGFRVSENRDEIRIETDVLEAAVRKRGYVSGVAAGSLLDKRTGARDAGFGLDIVDWLMEPGSDEASRRVRRPARAGSRRWSFRRASAISSPATASRR
jgi:hypothetical protein